VSVVKKKKKHRERKPIFSQRNKDILLELIQNILRPLIRGSVVNSSLSLCRRDEICKVATDKTHDCLILEPNIGNVYVCDPNASESFRQQHASDWRRRQEVNVMQSPAGYASGFAGGKMASSQKRRLNDSHR
jgi:hypothetical protein